MKWYSSSWLRSEARFIEGQQLGVPHERLRYQQTLLLASRELINGAICIPAAANVLDDPGYPLSRGPSPRPRRAPRKRQREPPAITIEPQPDDVNPAQARARLEGVPLRQVADRGIARAGSLAQDAHAAAVQRQRAQPDPAGEVAQFVVARFFVRLLHGLAVRQHRDAHVLGG